MLKRKKKAIDNSGSQTPAYTPPAMPKTNPPKPGTTPSPKACSCKQHTVLSVRDFAILYRIASEELDKVNRQTEEYVRHANNAEEKYQRHKEFEQWLKQDMHYQDLLRIREKLGELNIEIETPIVEVEE